jgi:hypothetical protein
MAPHAGNQTQRGFYCSKDPGEEAADGYLAGELHRK